MTSKKRPTTAFLLRAAPVPQAPHPSEPDPKIAKLFLKGHQEPERVYFPYSTPALLQTLNELFLASYAPRVGGDVPVSPQIAQTAGTKYMAAGLTLGWQESPAMRESIAHFLADLEECSNEGIQTDLTHQSAKIAFLHPYAMIETLMRMAARYPHIVPKDTVNAAPEQDERGPQETYANYITLRNHAVNVFSATSSLYPYLTDFAPTGPHISQADCQAAAYRVMKRGATNKTYVIDIDRLMTLAALDCNEAQPYAHAAYH